MNSAARLINEQAYAGKWSFAFAKTSGYQLSIQLLLLSILLTAVSIVYMTNMSRSFTQAAGHSAHKQSQLQTEYGQLLLEKGTLSAQARIESMAKSDLNMVVPKTKKVIVVNQ